MPDGRTGGTGQGDPAGFRDIPRAGQPVHALRVRHVAGTGVPGRDRSSVTPTTRWCTARPSGRPGRSGPRWQQRLARGRAAAAPRQDQDRVLQGRQAPRRDCADTSFTFLGYTFRARNAPAQGREACSPGSSPRSARTRSSRMSEEVRSWRIHLRTATELHDLARWINPIVQRMDQLLVRHEALLLRMEVKDRPSPCCRSSRVKLEAA